MAMRQLTLTSETIKNIKKYFDNFNDFDNLDYEDGEGWESVEGAEFKQGDTTIYVDGEVHAYYDECINDRYGGYEDNCSEWVNDQYEINNVEAYTDDQDEVQITNLNELLAA